MKIAMFCIVLLLCSFYNTPLNGRHHINYTHQTEYHGYFRLMCYEIGFGSNMFHLQPVFKISNDSFVYSMEQAWLLPGDKKQKPRDVLTGIIRASSIDSIMDIINGMKDTTIYNINPYVMSGGETNFNIFTDYNSVCFTLHNAYNPVAKKILDILNTYIPTGHKRLWIMSEKYK